MNQIIVLWEKADIIGDKRALFGKEFRKHIAEIKKAKRRQWWFQNRHQIPFDQLSFNRKRKACQAFWFSRKKTQYILPYASLKNVYAMGRKLFVGKTITEIPIVDCIKCFLELWKLLTKDQSIWTVVHGYKVQLLTNAHQKYVPQNI